MKFRLKRTACRGLAFLLRVTGVIERLLSRGGTVVLMYHRVLPGGAPDDWPLKSLVVDASEFEEHIAWLAERFELCTAFEAICHESTLGRPRAVVTFDDGYADNFLYAAPILKKFSAKATFFVTSGFIGTEGRMWFDVAANVWQRTGGKEKGPDLSVWMASLKRMSVKDREKQLIAMTQPEDWNASRRDLAMTWQEIDQLKEAGHEIGCHSRSHPILTTLNKEDLRSEVVGGVNDLHDRGIEPQGIAYPNGNHNETVVAMVHEAKLQYGVTTSAGWYEKSKGRFRVGRIDVNPGLIDRWSADSATGLGVELARRRFPSTHT